MGRAIIWRFSYETYGTFNDENKKKVIEDGGDVEFIFYHNKQDTAKT